MSGTSSSASTVTVTASGSRINKEPEQNVTLKLRKPKNKKAVKWTSETIDNEHMNKKKSKCCCIYEKPRAFDESSSDTDDECNHCVGHVELKNKCDITKDES